MPVICEDSERKEIVRKRLYELGPRAGEQSLLVERSHKSLPQTAGAAPVGRDLDHCNKGGGWRG